MRFSCLFQVKKLKIKENTYRSSKYREILLNGILKLYLRLCNTQNEKLKKFYHLYEKSPNQKSESAPLASHISLNCSKFELIKSYTLNEFKIVYKIEEYLKKRNFYIKYGIFTLKIIMSPWSLIYNAYSKVFKTVPHWREECHKEKEFGFIFFN